MKFLYDFFPILLFFVAYKLGDIYIATAVAIAAAAAQTLVFWIRHRRFEKMHLITFGLLLFFGGLTLLLRDPLFIKWKPSVVNWLFAVVFLGSHWVGEKPIVERMMGHAIRAPHPVWLRLSWMWITFFISIGLLNLYVAYTYSEETWVNFKLFGMLGITFAFVIAQGFYLSRYIIEENAEENS